MWVRVVAKKKNDTGSRSWRSCLRRQRHQHRVAFRPRRPSVADQEERDIDAASGVACGGNLIGEIASVPGGGRYRRDGNPEERAERNKGRLEHRGQHHSSPLWGTGVGIWLRGMPHAGDDLVILARQRDGARQLERVPVFP